MIMHGRNISIIHGAILKHLEKEACLSSKPMLSQRCTPAAGIQDRYLIFCFHWKWVWFVRGVVGPKEAQSVLRNKGLRSNFIEGWAISAKALGATSLPFPQPRVSLGHHWLGYWQGQSAAAGSAVSKQLRGHCQHALPPQEQSVNYK